MEDFKPSQSFLKELGREKSLHRRVKRDSQRYPRKNRMWSPKAGTDLEYC